MRPLLTWIVTGFLVGWLVRVVMGSRRDFGVLGDLTIGLLGGITGGWLFDWLGVTAPASTVAQVFVAITGAVALVGALRVLRQIVPAHIVAIPGAGPGEQDLEHQIKVLNEFERRILSHVLGRRRIAVDPNSRFDAQLTFGQRMADRVAAFGGSWIFIGLFVAGLVVWMIVNEQSLRPFDPYPFILLNLVLSCLAALQAPVIMMSQNRMAAKDRLDAHDDYQVNLRAEMEIMGLHAKLDAVREREWTEFLAMQREQLDSLRRIETRLRGVAEADATQIE